MIRNGQSSSWVADRADLKRSSQHSEVGGCDEHSKAAIGIGLDGRHYRHQDGRLWRDAMNRARFWAGDRRGAEQAKMLRSKPGCRSL